MSINLLGRKIGMTQIFDLKGEIIPVTVIQAGPCFITQLKSKKTCGYDAIQIGYLEISFTKKRPSITKPELGHLTKSALPPLRHLKEYLVKDTSDYKIGEKIEVNSLKIGDLVKISGRTIGKGNAGNIKKNHFSRGGMSHGSKHHRLQGSMGAGTSPGRVFPGKKMPGRLGMDQRTIKNLQVLGIDLENHLLIIKGCVPGKFGNLVSIEKN